MTYFSLVKLCDGLVTDMMLFKTYSKAWEYCKKLADENGWEFEDFGGNEENERSICVASPYSDSLQVEIVVWPVIVEE